MLEEQIIKVVQPHIERCRPGDWEHAKRVVSWIKKLGEGRDDLVLLITAGYIHDIGWRDLVGKEEMTLKKLFELELQANQNSEPYVMDILRYLNLGKAETQTLLRLVSAADKHRSTLEDEEIIVDADQLSKLDINHLKEKFQKSEWLEMCEKWENKIGNRVKTEKAKFLYPKLLASLKKSIRELE
ncbi:MAG: hypothetical protein Q8P21_01950 [bacterium]|nr:hypothetical protein [bacterium]